MARKRLTDATLKALRPAAPGARYVVWDSEVPHFGVRVTERGVKTYIVQRRLPGSGKMVRHALGRYHPKLLPLSQAREQAYDVLRTIRQGDDPNALKRRQRQEQAREQARTFAGVVEEYAALRLRGLRKGHDVETFFKNHLIPKWGDLPIGAIAEADVAAFLAPDEAAGRIAARNRKLTRLKAFFNWAKEPGRRYRPDNPAAEIKTLDEPPRQRVLDDDELRAVWQASHRAEPALGGFVRLLLLLGQRRTEVAGMRRSEIRDGVWLIPAERVKTNTPHAVPLPPAALAEIAALPNTGDHLFPGRNGGYISNFSRLKSRFDALCPVENWTFHDLRRSMRTGLSRLRIDAEIAEALLNHTPERLRRTYDTYDRLDEKRAALERWSAALARIVEGKPALGPDNVMTPAFGMAG